MTNSKLINILLLYASSSAKIEAEVSEFFERETLGEFKKEDFRDWVFTYDPEKDRNAEELAKSIGPISTFKDRVKIIEKWLTRLKN